MPFVDSSLRPSCSWIAVKMDGGAVWCGFDAVGYPLEGEVVSSGEAGFVDDWAAKSGGELIGEDWHGDALVRDVLGAGVVGSAVGFGLLEFGAVFCDDEIEDGELR